MHSCCKIYVVIKMKFIVIYLVIMNVIAMVVCVTDKIKARLHLWRIPDSILMAISLLGGALGMYTTMQIVRHKTQTEKYTIGLPIMIVIQAAAVYGVSRLFA